MESTVPATEMFVDEMGRDDKIDWLKTGMLNGEVFDRSEVGSLFDVQEDTASSYLAEVRDELADAGFAVDTFFAEDRKQWELDAGPRDLRENMDAVLDGFDYLPSLDAFRHQEMAELNTKEQQARYIADVFTGADRELWNKRYEGKADELNMLYVSDPGFGTKFHDDAVWEGLLEVVAGRDIDGVVFNGDVVPWVPKRAYKTALDQMDSLGYDPEKEPNKMAQELIDVGNLARIIDDELVEGTGESKEEYAERIMDNMDFDLGKNAQKIVDSRDAINVARRKINGLKEVLGEDVELYFKPGEQTRFWKEDMYDYKKAEYSDLKEEVLEGLDKKIESFYTVLSDLRDIAEQATEAGFQEKLDDTFEDISDIDPLDVDLESYEPESEDEKRVYEDLVEEQAKLFEEAEQMRKYSRTR